MRSHVLVCAIFALLLRSVSGGNVLFLSGVASPSHHLYNRVLVLGLAEKGHNVTFLSADIVENSTLNVHYIHLEKVYEFFYQGDESLNVLHYADQSALEAILDIPALCGTVCDGILASKGLAEVILNYPNDFKFDVIIYDFTFGPCLVPLVAKFNFPPVVSVSAFANPPYTTDVIGGQNFPAYVPYYSLDYPVEMTFFQRTHNLFLYFIDFLSRKFILYPNMDKQTRKRFKFNFPNLKDLEQNSSLMLVNTDNAIDRHEPLQPNMIQVGGLQISEAKPLPKEMEKFVVSGKKGTVLMSLGTNVKSNMLGDKRLKAILETFKEIPDYNFIWKFESEVKDLPVTPSKNVMVSKFLPQNDILAHPHVKAFISHSGMLSTHEAFWYGKPIIGMPFFVDQHMNLRKVLTAGVGVKVDFRNLTTDNFKTSVLTVLDNPIFWRNSQKVMNLFQDKPKKPLEVAVWWIEYAMRNINLEYLKSPTRKLGSFVSKSYDILAVLVISIHLVIYIFIKIVTVCCRRRATKSKRE